MPASPTSFRPQAQPRLSVAHGGLQLAAVAQNAGGFYHLGNVVLGPPRRPVRVKIGHQLLEPLLPLQHHRKVKPQLEGMQHHVLKQNGGLRHGFASLVVVELTHHGTVVGPGASICERGGHGTETAKIP